jgi:hypothetical protein
MAYQLQVGPEYGYTNAASSFIVAFSVELLQYKPSKLKFLSGLAVAIFVAAFDLDEEPDENEHSLELDVKKFEPIRQYSSLNLEAMGKSATDDVTMSMPTAAKAKAAGMLEATDTLLALSALHLKVIDHHPMQSLRIEPAVMRPSSSDSLPLSESGNTTARDQEDDDLPSGKSPRYGYIERPKSIPQMSLSVPTWAPASCFSFPIAEIPVKYLIYDNLTLNSFADIKHIADGSNANIFSAKLHDEKVIIKMIKEQAEDDPIAIQEFGLEYGSLARMDHPHIIRVLGAGKLPRQFIVLECLCGGALNTMLMQNQQQSSSSLAQKLFRKPTFTYVHLLQTARAMAEALDYLHHRCHPGATIIHRGKDRWHCQDPLGFALCAGADCRLCSTMLQTSSLTMSASPKRAISSCSTLAS